MARKEAVMLPGMNTISSTLATHYYEPTCDNLEQYAQRHGHVSSMPTLRDRICLRTGALLIAMGVKLMAVSLKHTQFSEGLT
jgi:hypothetical protein